jgi:hypothetical protein
LLTYGIYFEKKPSSEKVYGQDKQCFQNSLVYPLDMYCGYAVLKDAAIPIAHCWNVDSNNSVVDSTPLFNKSHVFYWGIHIDKDVARAVDNYAKHGNEFMDCWRSAVENVSDDVVCEWRKKLNWTEA